MPEKKIINAVPKSGCLKIKIVGIKKIRKGKKFSVLYQNFEV
jgi:hypothetical protein